MFVQPVRLAVRLTCVPPASRQLPKPRFVCAMTAGWRKALDTSLERHKDNPVSRFFQLATVRSSGKPANRTMVFRGFLENTDQVQFVTDHRTEKLEEFKNKDWAEIAWYFPETKEQFRIGGSLEVIGADSQDTGLQKAREQAWAAQGAGTRKWYTQPNPGKPRDPDDSKFNKEAPEDVHPEFVLVLLDSAEVDYLDLNENKRSSFTSSGSAGQRQWKEEPLNP